MPLQVGREDVLGLVHSRCCLCSCLLSPWRRCTHTHTVTILKANPPSTFPPQRYVDGGFTGLQPVSSLEEAVITVSPFTGELDICPRDCPAIFLCFQIFNGSIQISIENLCRISYALFPPSAMVSHQVFFPASFWLKQINAGPAFPSFKVQFNHLPC